MCSKFAGSKPIEILASPFCTQMPTTKCPGISDCQRNWKTIVVSAISTTTLGIISWSQISIPRWWCFERGLLDGRLFQRWRYSHGCQQKATPVNPPIKVEGIRKSWSNSSWPEYVFFFELQGKSHGQQISDFHKNTPIWFMSSKCTRVDLLRRLAPRLFRRLSKATMLQVEGQPDHMQISEQHVGTCCCFEALCCCHWKC